MDLERFIEECRRAGSQGAIRELLEKAMSEPAGVLKAVGEPERAGVHKLHVADDLTVLNVIWGPNMTIMPHNHDMWALIGIYTGREDNIFWKRVPEDKQPAIRPAGVCTLVQKEVATLGKDIIHSVNNPLGRLTGAIHIYGGQFFTQPRREWDPETFAEGAYSSDKTMRLFEESNRRL
jgi:predicted metal-dependent enzyme (double-stranded beta helix superfamily)